MKLAVIGFGQCGGRLADEFARLNKNARGLRDINIISEAFAVDTEARDLADLNYVTGDYLHRILIGARLTHGKGLGGDNHIGADIAREARDSILDAVRTDRQLFEADAFLLIAGAGGGIGSGAIAIIAQALKERYAITPVYAMVVLPDQDEQEAVPEMVANTAICLKSVSGVADAVFLMDRQKYVSRDSALRDDFTKLNELMIAPFYNMLCVGEEKNHKYVGAKMLDAGDIIQILSGWTAIGHSVISLPILPFLKRKEETARGVMGIDDAIAAISAYCQPGNAARAAYLVSGPSGQIDVALVKEIGNHLRDITGRAMIRDGDYPRERTKLEVVVVLSHLSDVAAVRDFYGRLNQA